MSFDWTSFCRVGDNCITVNDEHHHRSAVGRYYYAAFNVVHEYLKAKRLYRQSTNPITGKPFSVHQNTIHCFEQSRSGVGTGFHDYEASVLDRLRTARNICDYDNRAMSEQDYKKFSSDAKADSELIIKAIAIAP